VKVKNADIEKMFFNTYLSLFTFKIFSNSGCSYNCVSDQIRTINLGANPIGDEGFASITESLIYIKEDLKISVCGITKKGVETFANKLAEIGKEVKIHVKTVIFNWFEVWFKAMPTALIFKSQSVFIFESEDRVAAIGIGSGGRGRPISPWILKFDILLLTF